jgi:hypothetical protein
MHRDAQQRLAGGVGAALQLAAEEEVAGVWG